MKNYENKQYLKEQKEIMDKKENEKEIELIKNIIKTRNELKNYNTNYEFAESDLVDYYIYEIKANQAKLDYLIKQAKIKGIVINNLDEVENDFFEEEIS